MMVHEKAAQLWQAGNYAGAMKLASQRLIWLNDQPPLTETWAKRLREREQGRLFSIISFGMLENGNMVSRKPSGAGGARTRGGMSHLGPPRQHTPHHPYLRRTTLTTQPPSPPRIRAKRRRSSTAPSSSAGRRKTG